jgi:CBS domain containing-hemolysin-like protein
MPVYRESIDDIVGLVYAKDIFRVLQRPDERRSFDVRNITREALSVPESLPIDDCLALMKARRTHSAIVIDEYGGTAGLLTLEDIMEMIVGEVHDEFERPGVDIEALDDGAHSVNGLVLIEQFNRAFGVEIDDPNFDTIGGYVFGQLGRKPELGDEVRAGYLTLCVDDLDGLRIARLRVSREQRATIGASASTSE